MQRGIDSFFPRVSNTANKNNGTIKSPPIKKRKALVISSDEEDSPNNKKSRIDNSKLKKPSLSKLKSSPKSENKKIDPAALFDSIPERVEAKKPPKPKDSASLEFEDNDIDKSLMEIDFEEVSKPQTNGKANEKSKRTPVKRKHDEEFTKSTPTNGEKERSFSIEEKHKKHDNLHEKQKEKLTAKIKKENNDDLNSSVLTDEERHERKRMAAALFQKYKNRSSCLNHGSKEVPKGKPNCLAGLSFLVTGILESLERDEASSIIQEYGGKVMKTVGKRLNFMIVGEEAGPKKLAQAEELGIQVLSEDGFFDLIRQKSGDAKISNGERNMKNEPSPNKIKKTPPKNKNVNAGKEIVVKVEKVHSPHKEKEIKQKFVEKNNTTHIIKKESLEKTFEAVNSKLPEVSKDVKDHMLTWVDKYKPTSIKDIIGQQGPASNVKKLLNWLSKWYINHDNKKKLQKPNPWAKNDDGSFYKAALLSGPPGIGKTTTATLVCKELGFDAVEFNASDTRSKRLLKEEVSELLSNKSLYGYFHDNAQTVTKKHVLIMDEVDGMAGNEDRGGIQELIALIKDSSVPIICMCNDRNHQKMRSLVNYCYDLRFSKPRLEQIKGCISSICFREKFKIEPSKLEEIISATNNDIRQTINHISLLSAGKELALKNSGNKVAEKDLKLGPWEVVRKVFSQDEHKHMNFNEKCDLFFHDYSLGPLFVQQNYLSVKPHGEKTDIPRKVALTADSLSLSDLVEKRIRTNSAWSLLPTQAIFSSVLPGEYMSGYLTGQINFPGWLGKQSRATKRNRLAQEVHDHTRLRTSGSRISVRLDYAPFLLDKIIRPLKEKGLEGVAESLDVIKEYHLLREDIDSLMELTAWPGKKSPMDAVDSKVKAALTRAYNKEVLAYSYSANAGIKKKRAEASDDAIEYLNDDGEENGDNGGNQLNINSDEENEDDKLENDGLIKAKISKPTTSKAGNSKKTTSTSTKTKNTISKSKK